MRADAFVKAATLAVAGIPALGQLDRDPRAGWRYGSFSQVPKGAVENVRNEMYLASEAIHRVTKDCDGFSKTELDTLDAQRLISVGSSETKGLT